MKKWIKAKVISPNSNDMLNGILRTAIPLRAVKTEDDMTLAFLYNSIDRRLLENLVEKYGGSITHPGGEKYSSLWHKLIHRPLFALSVLMVLFLTLWLPERILFYSVVGNRQLSAAFIMDRASKCGLVFGADRRDIRSEKIKNQIIKMLPQLSWVGINTNGCTATIYVEEAQVGEKEKNAIAYSNLVAAHDGVVISSVTTAGEARCVEGQAVKKGQILISGMSSSGILGKAQRAQGEVYALTKHTNIAVLPHCFAEKGDIVDLERKICVVINKKRINLSKDSGISHAGYDRIYKESFLVLPGGFVLPVSLITETYVLYEPLQPSGTVQDPWSILAQQADSYLLEQSDSCRIINRASSSVQDESLSRLITQYYCIEMIAKESVGEIVIDDG